MRHLELTDEIVETASLYAAGALTPDEALAFERHLSEGCEICAGEVRGLLQVSSALLLSGAPQTAPARVREKLQERVADDAFAPDVHLARAGDDDFSSTPYPGVTVKQLYAGPPGGVVTLLVRMKPGAVYPSHSHADIEHCYVLEGDLFFTDGVVMRAGDYSAVRTHSKHPPSYTVSGCLLLVIASQQNAVL